MTIMALCQFDLTRCFGYPYTKDKGAGWGAPIVDHAITLDEIRHAALLQRIMSS